MLQAHANDLRSRLRLTASALVIAAASLGSSAAYADVTVASGTTYDLSDTSVGTYVIPTGVTAEAHYDNSAALDAANADLTTAWVANLSSGSNASLINVQSGGTLHIYNPWYWAEWTNMIVGDAGSLVVVHNHGDMNFYGTNYFYGDLYLQYDQSEAWSPPVVNLGQSWNYTTTYFGTTSRILMDAGTTINFYEPHSVTNTIDSFVSSGADVALDGAATVNFYNGTMIVNGANTASEAFIGTVAVNPGATFMVGDSSHSSAVFGDPNASAVTITVSQSGGTLGTLSGYGTIYGSVINNSRVAPGGTSGTAGTLTIMGNYTQSSTGMLLAEVTPTGVSGLVVSGTANLAGTLMLKIDDGDYSTPGKYDVLTAGSVSGAFDTISTQGTAAFAGAIATTTGYEVVVESQNSAQTFAHQAANNRSLSVAFSRSLFDRIDDVAGSEGKAGLWVAPYGDVENISRDGLGYNSTTYGVRAGYERHVSWMNAVFGAAVSYGSTKMDSKGDTASADIDSYNYAIYGGVDFLNARVDGSLYMSSFTPQISRDLGGSYGTETSSPDGWGWGGSVQISRSIFNNWVSPYAAGYFSRVHLGATSETGVDDFALAFDALDKNYMSAELGAKVHVIKPTASSAMKLDVSVALAHDFSDKGEMVTGGFANITGSSAVYSWAGDSENTLVTGISFADAVTDKIEIFARANGQFSLYRRSGDFSIGAKYRF